MGACVPGIAMLAHADPDVGEAMAGAAALRADARIPAEMIGAARIARMVRVRVLVMIPPVLSSASGWLEINSRLTGMRSLSADRPTGGMNPLSTGRPTTAPGVLFIKG